MRILLLAGLLTASTCLAQSPAQEPRTPAPEQTPAGGANSDGTITIPAGTHVPVTLTSPLRLKKARTGDSVRVATAFPVTVGTQLAIPAGTYLEGVIDKIQRHGRGGDVHLQMSFTRMIYANGYEVALSGASVTSKADGLDEPDPGHGTKTGFFPMSNGFLPQQTPVPPPPPQVGPSRGAVIGVTVGVAAAVTVIGILIAHHNGGGNEVVLDAGTQFDLIFQSPISVDAARVVPAAGVE
ncbi:MAG TPA: hypothetical protein VLX32_01885 [Candidatus Acidoferrum sp.]|nr:hypothetical protein [Candidatus Acidoferrum sp.]